MTVNTADFHGQKYGEATGKTNLYNLVVSLFKHTNEPWEKKLLRSVRFLMKKCHYFLLLLFFVYFCFII